MQGPSGLCPLTSRDYLPCAQPAELAGLSSMTKVRSVRDALTAILTAPLYVSFLNRLASLALFGYPRVYSKLNNVKAIRSRKLTLGRYNRKLLPLEVSFRKEVIQPHSLPRYGYFVTTSPLSNSISQASFALGYDFGVPDFSWCDGRCVQGPERIHRGMLIRDY